MRVLLIGGTPSSGSSLLMNLLSALPGVCCLPETGLFCHGRNLVTRKDNDDIESLQWRVPWVKSELKVKESLNWDVVLYDEDEKQWRSSFDILADRLKIDERRIVVEKTPENIFAFQVFLESDRNNRVVVTSRDVWSGCHSLVRRGFSYFDALLIWFSHSYEVFHLLEKFPDQVLHCPYDELLAERRNVLDKICEFAAIDRKFDAVDPNRLSDEQWMLNVANWNLEATSWSKSASGQVGPVRNDHLLGLDFDALLDSLYFSTRTHGTLSPRFVNTALKKKLPIPEPIRDRMDAVFSNGNSEMIECLSNEYPVFRNSYFHRRSWNT